MRTLSVLTWIGNAAAVLCGRRGAIAAQARAAGCSRQAAYQQARRVERAVQDAQQVGPSREELRRQVQALQEENRQLWQALEQTIDFPKAKQQRFAVTAAAAGLSDRQIAALLRVLLGPRHPRRASVGRWVQAAGRQAGRLLGVLDRLCEPLVRALCLDEIYFHRRPMLVGVEPRSLACVLARRSPDCTAATWERAVQPWAHLEQAVADGGRGLQGGLAACQRRRRQDPAARPLDVSLDVFHTHREARRALRQVWSSAEAVWRRWDAKERQYRRLRWRGVAAQDPAANSARAQLSQAKRRAEAALAAAERQEQAWRRVRAALEWLRPDGALNDRAWAQAQIAGALPALAGPAWTKVRQFLRNPRSLAFLDRLHQQLAAAQPRAEARAALVRLWYWRRPGGPPGAAVAQAAACQRLVGNDWPAAYGRVARVLSEAVRASSVVECLNSVWRLHQSRHRTLTQGLIDLKRLYWNSRAFAEGKRRGKSPYQWLGLGLPTYDPWELLQLDPEQLAQQLSTTELAA